MDPENFLFKSELVRRANIKSRSFLFGINAPIVPIKAVFLGKILILPTPAPSLIIVI